jgi:hypothetical protein
MKTHAIWLPCVLAAAVIFPLNAAAATTSFSFNLHVPNTATASSGNFSGDSIRLTGAGSFDTQSAAVVAGGSFTIFDPTGTAVVENGSWRATGFTSFTLFGGPHNGIQGGLLTITVTLTPTSGTPLTGQTMVVTCVVFAPPGLEEGTTVGPFLTKTGGATLFHENN